MRSGTNSSINFGGLTVIYNRRKDNFTLKPSNGNLPQAYVDRADCPDTILFMLKHYRFDGWSERVIKEGEL